LELGHYWIEERNVEMAQNVNKSINQRALSRRLEIALGVIIGLLILLTFILPKYVKIDWDRPVNQVNPQITVTRDGETVAGGNYQYEYSKEPNNHLTPTTELTDPIAESGVERGQALYQLYCIACHGKKGSGGDVATVPLVDVAQEMNDAKISGFISDGLPGTSMPGFRKTLTDEQIENLVAFIRTW
jgi:mono/diheme cytochrome c family protein